MVKDQCRTILGVPSLIIPSLDFTSFREFIIENFNVVNQLKNIV